MLEYDATTRNPKWVYEVLRRPNSFSSTEANRKKSKFYADHSIPETLKVSVLDDIVSYHSIL